MTTTEKAKYTLVNIIDSYDTENILYADMPIGTIVPFGGSGAPTMFLLCDGSEVAKATYPELYEVIGDVFGTASDATLFCLPDLRECVPVGVGKNITKSIANHDRYNLGQFKDDQIQDIGKMKAQVTSGYSLTSGGIAGYINANSALRTGETTHGKQLGVNYIIKAKESGMPTDVTEGVRDVVSEMESYSTAETDTGKTWIDGKRIYRKCYKQNANIALYEEHWLDSTYGIDVTEIEGFSSIIRAYYCGATVVADMEMDYRSSHWYVHAVDSHSGSTQKSTANDYVVLEYTKTT